MFALKKYQDDALDILERFLRRVRVAGIEAAWRECAPAVTQNGNQLPYRNEAFGEIPCVCLRLPTGGGKTLLAAHAVARIGKAFRDTDAPVVLWLTPSDTIRTQTAAALNTAGHPYRQALSTGQNPQSPQEILEFLGEVEGDVTQGIEAMAEEGLERSPKGFFKGIGRSWS